MKNTSVSRRSERCSNEAGLLAGSGGGAVLHVFPAGRPCLLTAQCLTAAGDGGLGGGAAQSYTWIHYHLLTSWLALLAKIRGLYFQTSPGGDNHHFRPVFLSFMGN